MEESSSKWEDSCDKCTSKFRTSLLISYFPSSSMALPSSADLHLRSELLTVSSFLWPLFPICNFPIISTISNILPPPICLATLKYLNCSRTDCHCIDVTETFHGTCHVHSVRSVGESNCARRSMGSKLRHHNQWPTVFKNVRHFRETECNIQFCIHTVLILSSETQTSNWLIKYEALSLHNKK
jgi:hypothetical protein